MARTCSSSATWAILSEFPIGTSSTCLIAPSEKASSAPSAAARATLPHSAPPSSKTVALVFSGLNAGIVSGRALACIDVPLRGFDAVSQRVGHQLAEA